VLDASLKALVARRGGPPGVIAVVQRGHHREVHAFGVRNIKRSLPMRANVRMRMASTSKAFSGAVALSLVSDGKLSLKDTIGERLPGLPKTWHEITLRQLLDHTSGLPNFTADPDYLAALSASPENAPPPRKLLSYVEHEALNFEPGSEYRYSNSDNIVVGIMVQDATGESYEQQLRERVFGPLGLGKTSLPRGVNLKTPYIHGYDNDPSQRPPEDISEVLASGWVWASGGMVSTPYDFTDFVRGYVGAGSSMPAPATFSARSSRAVAPSRPDRGRTRRAWGSSATRPGAGRCGATRVTTPATPSSWRRARTASAR
jgi:D-alanyl-D-alanine carboxypeptidase